MMGPINMRTCVGKPTLRVDDAKTFSKLSYVNFAARRERRNGLGEGESMAGANHRRDPLLALKGIGSRGCERSEPLALGKAQRGIEGRFVGMRIGWRAVRLVDTSHPQLVGKPALAVAARAQRARLGHRVDAVVHIAELS